MNPQNDTDLRSLLKESVPPASHTELSRDLWPQMLEKLSGQPVPAAMRVPWFDWALGGLAAAALIFFPGIIPALFYHL
jgi:hypothetical protein